VVDVVDVVDVVVVGGGRAVLCGAMLCGSGLKLGGIEGIAKDCACAIAHEGFT